MSESFSWRGLLLPFVPAYRVGLALREFLLRSGHERVQRLAWPVVSVGNLSTGGTGKTPLVIALAQALARRGVAVDVLSRGYGRVLARAARVDPDGVAEHSGDEPLLIAREAGVPVYVGADRYEAGLLAEARIKSQLGQPAAPGRAGPSRRPKTSREPDPNRIFVSPLEWAALVAEAQGKGDAEADDDSKPASSDDLRPASSAAQPSVPGETGEKSEASAEHPRLHLLDDGFQHRQLAREVDIVLVNRSDWGDLLLPAGNLREPVEAIRRAQVVAIPAEEPPLETVLRKFGWTGPVWRLRRQMDVPPIAGPVIAFCGIARPEQFFAGLESAGLQVASRIAFADHHRYLQHDLDCLLDAARSVQAAALVTTEKDLARLGALAQSLSVHLPLETAKLRTRIENESAAIEWLIDRVRSHP